MNSETLKRDISARLFENLKVKDEDGNVGVLTSISTNESYECVSVVYNGETDILHIEEIKPCLFPTSALTKPIQIASYNNGEPFVPIVEMAKMLGWNVQKFLLNSNTESFGIMCDASLRLMDEDVQDVLAFTINAGFGWHSRHSKNFHVVLKQPELYDLMHKFHINYRLSPEQFIEVTNEFNPYL